MNIGYLIPVGLCLGGLAIRTLYERRKQAGKVDTENKLIFAAVFAGMCMMLLSWPFMTLLDPCALVLPDPIRWLGLTLLIASLGLAAGGLLQLGGLENIDRLVTTGLFARIRHPMYTGFILWIAGWLVFYGAAVSFIFGLIGVSSILYWRRMEERKLAAQFGEEYQRYIKQTWF